MTVRRAVLLLAVLVIAAPARVHGHDVSRSESRLEVHGTEVAGTLTLDLVEFPGVDVNGDGFVSYEELDRAIDRVYAALKGHFVVGDPGPPVRTRVERYEIVENHLLRLDVRYAFERPLSAITVESTLHQITRPDHRHLISVRFGDDVQESVLGAGAERAVFDRTAAHPSFQTFRKFVTLGIEHIFTGYDHLAFLVCLLIATTTFSSLVAVITSFTLAHSITLALATFDVVILPTRVTESLIALSIAYVAIENLFQFRAVERSRITFLFGLVHGFGFSTVLRAMQLPRGGLALSLFSFNAGVEVGQIVFVATMFPLVVFLSSRRWPQLRPAVSASVMCLAAYWFVQRAFLG
jgi:HupE/UreJ protein